MSRYHPHIVDGKATDLAGQFLLGAHAITAPPGWDVSTVGSWTLATHPALFKADVVAADGSTVGWLLGAAVTPQAELVTGTIRLETTLGWEAAGEQLAGELAGRFLLIVVSGPSPRVYPDAFAMQAAVYAPELGLVASTSSVIPVGAATPYVVPRILAVGAPYTNSMYPLGLTPRHGIERILPNHYLDLSRWSLVRRWPVGDLTFDVDPVTAQRRVAALASRTIRALADKYPIQSPLTAGRDSRLLLACARELVDGMTFFTAELPGELVGWRDVSVAKAIAKRLGLRYSVLRHRRARTADLREWVARTGGEAGELRGWHSIRTFQQIDPGRLTLNGWSGDIVQSRYFKNRSADVPVTVDDILRACHVPPLPEFVARAEHWLTSLPTSHPITTMDLLFAEQRGGCWSGVIEYGLDGHSIAHVAPMCQQEIIRMLIRLPEAYRRTTVFERDLIATQWPELAGIPFNDDVPVSPMRRRYFQARVDMGQLGPRLANAVVQTRKDPKWLLRKLRPGRGASG